MMRILIIFLLISTVAQGQNLRKTGSGSATHNYYGIHRYSIHPSWSLSDSLWLVNRKYVDSLVDAAIDAIEPVSTGYGIDSSVIGGTEQSILFVGTGGVLAQNNTRLKWNNSTLTFSGGHMVPDFNNFYNIGSASLRYLNLWVNGINLNTSGTAGAGNMWVPAGFSLTASTTPSALGGPIFNITSSTSAATTSLTRYLNLENFTFEPTSGGGALAMIYISPNINQTGTAFGKTRGIYDSTRLTSAVRYVAYENEFGEVVLNTSSGRTTIGTDSESANIVPRKFYVRGSIGVHKDSIPAVSSITSEFILLHDTAAGADLGRIKKILPSYFAMQSALNDSAAAIRSAIPSGSSGLADPGSNGIVARTALNTTTARTITGTTNRISITNGDGVSGNPTIDVGSDVALVSTLSGITSKVLPDADYTIVATDGVLILPDPSTTRTLTLPAASTMQNKEVTIFCKATSVGEWILSGQFVQNGLNMTEDFINSGIGSLQVLRLRSCNDGGTWRWYDLYPQ